MYITGDDLVNNAIDPKTAHGSRANALINENASALAQNHGRCLVCGGGFIYYRGHQRFCSSRCRLLRWAARVIVKEYLAGQLPGLEDEVMKLR